jgi:natural product biosynthesis luciferase-like monooxygenase protein
MSTSSRPDSAEQLTFWTGQIANGPKPFALPTDEPRLPAPSFMRETVSAALPPTTWTSVTAFAARTDVDPFAVVLAGVAIVAARSSGRQDLWIGTVASAGASGETPNLLALRLHVPAKAESGALVTAVSDTIRAAARHRDLPFANVARLSGVEPLLRLLVLPDGINSAAWESAAVPDARALGPDAATCDLIVTVSVRGDAPSLVASYDSELFQSATISSLLEQLRGALTELTAGPQAVVRLKPESALDFSLLYFASDEGDYAGVTGRDKYRLLLEGARFADENGFSAVWTPERHFHTFGGLFPSPSVAAGALAMITNRVSIRAGSVVLPLHNPVRVAEEWSLIDNLSNGRVGVSFAAGWQPQDFAMAPDAFADRHERMFQGIALVQSLWRGEAHERPGGDQKPVQVRTRPRPVQPELPTWVTAAGSPETFRRAGQIGANLLTHLLLQSIEQLSERIAAYRQAWQAAGHPGESGTVTLMLHTFVEEDDAKVRATVYKPFKNYLKGAVGLFAALAPKGLDLATASAEELDALADHAFDRYFHTSGLFGTPDSCAPMVERLARIGVTELACLVDFGVPDDIVLASLPWLAELRRRCHEAGAPAPEPAAMHSETRVADAVIGWGAGSNGSDNSGLAEIPEFVAPESSTEIGLAALWQDALGVGDVSALDNFFDSGGHSLLAMQLARRIRDEFAVDFALDDLFARPQLRELAAYLDELKAAVRAQEEAKRGEHAHGFEYGEI